MFSYFTKSINYGRVNRAGAIILSKDKTKIVLVLNRISYMKGEYKFGLPKGHLELNEKHLPAVGAQREVLEETGIFFPVDDFKSFIKICDTLFYILTLDSNAVNKFTPHDSKEIIYTGWFDLNSVEFLNTNRTLIKAMKQMDRIKNINSI